MPYPQIEPSETDARDFNDDHLDSYLGPYNESSAKIIPVTQERTTMDINTDDANSVSRFFQSIADKVVLASTLPAEVAELRASVERLKADVENYHERMIRADEEITNLRRERQALQDENGALRNDLSRKTEEHTVAETRWGQACQERDRWHNEAIAVSSTLEDTKRERDDAQMKIMELERDLRDALADKDVAQRQCDEVINKLNSIRSALA